MMLFLRWPQNYYYCFKELYKLLGGLLPVPIEASKRLSHAMSVSEQALVQE